MSTGYRAVGVLGAAILMGTVLAVPQSAQADPTPPCYGPSCVSKSPYISNASGNCSNGSDLETVTPAGGGPSVTLRWNDWCHSNWARFNGDDPGFWTWWVETTDGTREYGGNGYYTLMVDGTQLARACIVPYAYPLSDPSCTGWH